MSRTRSTNPFIRNESTSGDGSSSGPHPNKDRNSFIIVNNDIMILPGDQLGCHSSDDDDTFSSESSSSLHLPPPVPVSVNSSQAQQRSQQLLNQARARPSPSSAASTAPPTNNSTRARVPVAPPRKASMEWIPTPLPTPQSRRTQAQALAHDNQVQQQQQQQRSGQQQLRTEKQTAAIPSSSSSSSFPSTSFSPSYSPAPNSSPQRTPSFSTPQRPPRPTVSPLMSDLPLYSTRTTGPPPPLEQQQQQHTSTSNSGDLEMQERSRGHQQRPSVTRIPSVNNNDSYILPTPSPSRTVDNNNTTSSDSSLRQDETTVGRSLSTNRSGSSDGGRGDRGTGGRTITTATETATAGYHPTQSRSNNNKDTHPNALNYNSSASRSSSTRRVPNHIDSSTGQRQELRGDSSGGGISSFFGGLFGGGGDSGSNKSKNQTPNRTRKRKDTVGGLPASASGSKNDLIDRNQQLLHHQPSTEKQNGSAFVHQAPENRKKGLPGKDGRQPETDMFNFVDTMLDMPEDPKWSQVIVKLLKVLVVMCVCYFGLMALYFGAEFQAINHTQNFEILVVDLDNSMIGSNYLNFTKHLNGIQGQPLWVNHNSTVYPNMAAIQADVLNGRYWGAVVVQANASSNLLWSAANINANYDPTKAFAFVYEGGRDPLVVKPNVVATMYTTFLMFSKTFNPHWVKLAIASFESQNKSMSALMDAPQVLGTPIAFEEFDLHPITASIITSATSVAYIWIFLVAGGSTYLVANMVQPMTTKSSTSMTMVMMLLPLLMFLIALSFCYSLLLLTFGVPFAGGAPQFFSLFGGMLLLQCSVASMVLFLIYLIPVVFIPGFTITFVILNVIAVFNPVELMPVFYRWVYAMPFLNAVQIARYVLMGSYNRLKYNIPVLAVWILIPVILMPFAISRQKRVAHRFQQEEEEEGIKRSAGALRSDQKPQQQQQQPLNKDRKSRAKPVTTATADEEDDDEVVVLESKKQKKHQQQQQQQQKSSRRRRSREDDDNHQDEGDFPYHDGNTVSPRLGSHHQIIHRPSASSESHVFSKREPSEVK